MDRLQIESTIRRTNCYFANPTEWHQSLALELALNKPDDLYCNKLSSSLIWLSGLQIQLAHCSCNFVQRQRGGENGHTLLADTNGLVKCNFLIEKKFSSNEKSARLPAKQLPPPPY